MAWAALLKSAGSKAAMQSGKKIAENITKKVTEKKSKVTGKGIANKMLGGGGESSGGGALVVRPSTSIVSSPAGGLVPSSKVDEGGSLVVKSKEAGDLGLTPFMESITGVKESLNSIKESLNNNSEDAKKRLEKQRLLNAKLKQEEQEEKLETKKSGGIGKKLLAPATKAGKSFLEKLKTFFTNVLLGMLVNGLIGGSRDVVVAFIAGYKAYRMASDAARRFIFKMGSKVAKGLTSIPGKLKSAGKTVFNFLKGVGDTLVKWIRGTASKLKTAVQGGFKTLNKVRKTPIKQTLKSIKNSGIGKSVGNVINKIKTPKKTVLELGKKISDSGVGKRTGNVINKIKNFKPGQAAKGMFTGIKNFGAKKFKALTGWADNMAKGAMKNVNNVVKGGLEKANKIRNQITDFAQLLTKPAKLVAKVKGMLKGVMDGMVKNNDIVKKVMELKKDPKKIKQLITQVGKNKNVVKTTKVLEKGTKLKIAGLDAVLAALMGVIDYTFLGESPINALLRAAGALVGYTAGFAIGAPFGGVPGFLTGMAGGFVGEKAADLIARELSKTKLGSKPDPIMNDGRMLVRNPFSGKGEGERMDNIQDAKLGETSKEDVSKDISSSASYEEEEDSTVIIDGGGQQSSSAPSQARKTKFIPLGLSKETIVNSQYESSSKAALYKV